MMLRYNGYTGGVAARIAACFIAAGMVSLYIVIARDLFGGHPFSLDESSYLYQARIFASGQLTENVAGLPELLRERYVVWHHGHSFSKYGPGFPLVLSLGVLVGAPWVINPILSVLTLLILAGLARRFFGSTIASLGVVAVGFNPYFMGYAASYFAQSIALFLTVAAWWTLSKLEVRSESRFLILLVAICGYFVWTRPLDAFIVSGLSACFLWSCHRRRSALILIGAVAASTLLFCSYNFWLSGRFAVSTYPIESNELNIPSGGPEGWAAEAWRTLKDYQRNFVEAAIPLLGRQFFALIGPPLVAFIALGLVSALPRKWKMLCVGHFVAVVALYNLHPGSGWPQYGARYYYQTWADLALLATGGAHFIFGALSRIASARGAATIFVGCWIALLGDELRTSRTFFSEYTRRFDLVAGWKGEILRKCQPPAIVVMEDVWLPKPDQFAWYGDLRRFEFRNRDFIFLFGPTQLKGITAAFPGHSTCVVSWQLPADQPATPRQILLP